jgi:hypothetical protein
MKTFIELTAEDSNPVFVNINSIIYITPSANENTRIVLNINGDNTESNIFVIEDYVSILTQISKIQSNIEID